MSASHPLCLWIETANRRYGRTNNAYDPARPAGGSPGGEGGVVGSRGSPLGLGADIGGSIRIRRPEDLVPMLRVIAVRTASIHTCATCRSAIPRTSISRTRASCSPRTPRTAVAIELERALGGWVPQTAAMVAR